MSRRGYWVGPVAVCLLTAAHCGPVQGATLIEWRFDRPGDLEGWGQANHVTDLRVADGALCGTITGRDPFVRSPQFEIPATPWQRIELRLRTNCAGGAQVFWTNTTETRYGGFSPQKNTSFAVVGDGQWHEYRIRPWWHTEGRIILLRLDLVPAPDDGGPYTFALDYLRVVEEEAGPGVTRTEWDFTDPEQVWAADADAPGALTSGPVRIPTDDRFWVVVEMSARRGQFGSLRWVSDRYPGQNERRFPLRPDGRMHVYNLDMSENAAWDGELLLLTLIPSTAAGDEVRVHRITISAEPLGPPDVTVAWAGLENAVNRVGMPAPVLLALSNAGGQPARDLRIAYLQLPTGVRVVSEGEWRALPVVPECGTAAHRIALVADAPVTDRALVRLSGAGAPDEPVSIQLGFTPALGLPQADYVPPPQPVPTEYEIGAYYFPGWPAAGRWDPVLRHAPQRRPVLGWYDEGNPECVDWQIKWAVEHGISFFMVDWYWSAGARQLEHWVQAFARARYRSYLKWCVMWANHNPPGTHSEADQRAVTQYWLDNYFGMPEYYRIDGRPVVIIWSPDRMRQDMGGSDGVRRLLTISRDMARAAGYPDICFIAMAAPAVSTQPAFLSGLANEGFDLTTTYNLLEHGGKAEDPRYYSYELVAQSALPFLRARREAHPLPFLPVISTGWDSRPWHGDKAMVVYGRTPELFRRLCQDVKLFADESGLRRLALAPLNEWGEGSYIEPCTEFGFAMYDVVREVFCTPPAGGWPPNIVPADVGLGPYDLPPPQPRTVWDFSDGTQGWTAAMGVSGLTAQADAITFTTTSNDPALSVPLTNLPARDFAAVAIRMSIDGTSRPAERGQLFWSTPRARVSESTSVTFELIGDGQMHEYLVPVSSNPRWRGTVTGLRFDPCAHAGATVIVDEIRLVPAEGIVGAEAGAGQ